jgi:hypothetical protein
MFFKSIVGISPSIQAIFNAISQVKEISPLIFQTRCLTCPQPIRGPSIKWLSAKTDTKVSTNWTSFSGFATGNGKG